MIILENKTRFVNENYDTDDQLYGGRLVKESKIKWVAIYSNLILRNEIVNKVALTEIIMQDTRSIHLDDMTEEVIPIFTTI